MSSLAHCVLDHALQYIGLRETSHNRGPQIDEWIRRVGLDPTRGAYPWCAAFAWCMVEDACDELGRRNPLPATASVHGLWDRAPRECRRDDPSPGVLVLHDSGRGRGHVGIVDHIEVDYIVTVEGNTNQRGSREGDGVYQRRRSLRYANLGYLDPAASLKFGPEP